MGDLLVRLEGVRPGRRGWSARCPAHEDKSPSLSVCEGEGGRIVLHDFAGCEPSAICAAMGLTLKDLFPDTHRTASEIKRDRVERERKMAAKEKAFRVAGARLDSLRESERLIRAAKIFPTVTPGRTRSGIG